MSEQIRGTVSLEEFFAAVEQHPDTRFDFMDEELVEVSPKPLHGYIQSQLNALLVNWVNTHRVGHVHTEVLHVLNGEKFIPDISVNAQTAHDKAYFDKPPLLAVEIRSDTQSREAQRRKARRYIANNTPAVLLILPNEGVELFTPDGGDTPQVYQSGQVVASIPGFDGLRIEVDRVII